MGLLLALGFRAAGLGFRGGCSLGINFFMIRSYQPDYSSRGLRRLVEARKQEHPAGLGLVSVGIQQVWSRRCLSELLADVSAMPLSRG